LTKDAKDVTQTDAVLSVINHHHHYYLFTSWTATESRISC